MAQSTKIGFFGSLSNDVISVLNSFTTTALSDDASPIWEISVKISSASSTNKMHAPCSCASFLNCCHNNLTFLGATPLYLAEKSPPLHKKKGTPQSFPKDSTAIVLPFPGGPYKHTPLLSDLMPAFKNLCGSIILLCKLFKALIAVGPIIVSFKDGFLFNFSCGVFIAKISFNNFVSSVSLFSSCACS
ncbi:hypothetical protein S284_04120 [Candidatus Phytoplasma solani]|nr:hypothetical protein S284_04120 [Candidatus Phytoplasma solani]